MPTLVEPCVPEPLNPASDWNTDEELITEPLDNWETVKNKRRRGALNGWSATCTAVCSILSGAGNRLALRFTKGVL